MSIRQSNQVSGVGASDQPGSGARHYRRRVRRSSAADSPGPEPVDQHDNRRVPGIDACFRAQGAGTDESAAPASVQPHFVRGTHSAYSLHRRDSDGRGLRSVRMGGMDRGGRCRGKNRHRQCFFRDCRVGIIWFQSFRFTLYSQFLRPFGMRSVTVFKPCEELQHPSQNRTCRFPTSGSSD